MNRRKMNIARWYALGLAVLLVVACLMIATGTSLARYRSEAVKSLQFEVREPVAVCLGKVEYSESEITENELGDPDAGTFVPIHDGRWELNEKGQLQLQFAVANGTSDQDYDEVSRQFSVRLVATQGVQTGEDLAVTLILPPEEKADTVAGSTNSAESIPPTQIKATAVRIAPDTQLHRTFGDGWVFYFLDENGEEELFWTLEGGQFSWLDLDITVDHGAVMDTSLLQLQIVGGPVED